MSSEEIILFVSILFIVIILGVYVGNLMKRINKLHVRLENNLELIKKLLIERQKLAQFSAQETHSKSLQNVLAEKHYYITHNLPILEENWQNRLTKELENNKLELVNPVLREKLNRNLSKLEIASIFYNNIVSDTIELRNYKLVKALHLAGHASWPRYFNLSESQI